MIKKYPYVLQLKNSINLNEQTIDVYCLSIKDDASLEKKGDKKKDQDQKQSFHELIPFPGPGFSVFLNFKEAFFALE